MDVRLTLDPPFSHSLYAYQRWLSTAKTQNAAPGVLGIQDDRTAVKPVTTH